MGRFAVSLIIAALSALAVTAVRADELKNNPGKISLKPIQESVKKMDPAIIGGKAVTEGDFPASFFTPQPDDETVPHCTATLIGPQVILTAAHCVGHRKTAEVSITARILTGECRHHPDYIAGDKSADYALCIMGEPVPDGRPERLSTVTEEIQIGRMLLLAGYGCTKANVSGGGEGIFRAGLAKADKMPGAVIIPPSTKVSPNYFSTIPNPAADANAILCPGDSGGAVFCLADVQEPAGRRVVCGVNSRVQCLERQGQVCAKIGKISYLSSFATSAVKTWLTQQPGICGLDGTVSHLCRQP